MFDSNKDGTISVEELKTLVQNVGYCLSDIELNDLVKRLDKNHDGRIQFDGNFIIN